MVVSLKKIKSPTFIFFSCVLVLSVIVAILSKPYFTEPIFHVENNKYTFDSEQGNLTTYRSGTADPIQVRLDHQERTVYINHQQYLITKIDSAFSTTYNLIYPNGNKYEVQDHSGQLISFDAKGNSVSQVFFYVGSQRVLQDGEEQFPPATLVTAAYPEYHYTRGAPGYLFLALAAVIFGWCSFRYQKFQDFLFYLSLRSFWANDAEPSDFDYFLSKVCGIVVMIGALWIAFNAF
ncbi:hypothetical protein [Paenibacillus taichungensis]|uniref:hypothetical protein n=1 Tax=Paenibacillus taichungensis TaxID=484184 RepID=UPI00399EFA54